MKISQNLVKKKKIQNESHWKWMRTQKSNAWLWPRSRPGLPNTLGLMSPLGYTSGALTQAIRNFAKSLESWLTNAMMNIPEEMVRIKVGVIISHELRNSILNYRYFVGFYIFPFALFSPAGHIGQRLRPDPAPLHQSEPSGPGSPRRPPEHSPDQPDALWPQPRRLCQRPGLNSLSCDHSLAFQSRLMCPRHCTEIVTQSFCVRKKLNENGQNVRTVWVKNVSVLCVHDEMIKN